MLATLAHGETSELNYLVQEWIDGVTLGNRLHAEGLTAREALTVARGLADALGATHSVGVVHRDVKPSNVVLAGGRQMVRVTAGSLGWHRPPSAAPCAVRAMVQSLLNLEWR